ncbi:G protein-regulated inducer of neurite outgrowth 3 [Falco peregrinus]|uniref:G protein-regulated inducer of neurite outgrowth 3 n=1 Tax=Falco peregrinus TaxID=8954 RepID=UPI00247AFE5D|nr:G protein-regulated inducer of neurite outgrowth 3 [Falco peregrinus]XP_055651988.1 G protein-regulated inducer of neurite outgrowth 3 [Falco peregrinus]XP_055651989.1 G protein-regulated inducer of neurite outgrowth 3 [Falco peregrinus]XP_055651990.1 G protein-regulated inducer of neurite outgrowth 3 [Falco peregrinus]XP_055651991.1 G protein-regulated inducer of neurite outgrowth 3 [Falco peregrinus]XP_055651992.1 G protein-regulated inducer of neurite outgrowth 3 [Falco peregrinus]
MGTVPDPLRSAKLSLVTASAEEDHLGNLQSAKHQPQLPSGGERASNGFPCTLTGPAGACLFDLKCTAAASTQRCEQCHEDDASQQETLPSRLASKAVEGRPAAVEPASYSRAAGSQGPAAPAPAAVGAPLVGQGPEMMPAPQSSRQFVQGSQAKPSSLTQIDDSALKPQGTDNQPALDVLNYSSPGDPVRGNESCHTSQANLLQRGEKDKGAEKTGSAACQPASPARHTEADLGRDLQASWEAKRRAAGTTQLHPTDKTEVVQSSEAPAPSSYRSPHPVHNTDPEPGSPGPPQLSKFRETGTMTVQPESRSLTQEAASRTWRDAEVQAVAAVESKSASTSPTILVAFLKGNAPPEEEEELHVIYRGGMGLSQSAPTDSLSLQQKSLCSPGITSKSTVVTAVTASAQTQPIKLPGLQSDVVSPVAADNAKPVLPSSPSAVSSQGTSVGNTTVIGAARDSKDAAGLPVEAQVPPKPIPVEQLAVDSSNQTPAQSGSGAGEPSTTSAAALPGSRNNVQDPVHDVASNRLPLLCSTGSEVKQKEVLGSSEQKEVLGSSEQKPVQSKGASQEEAIANQSVVKPKEESSVVLDPKGGMDVSSQPAAVRVKACSEDAGGKEESRGQGDTGQAQMAGSRSLQAGLVPELSVSSTHATPPVETSAAPQQQGFQAKEPGRKLHTATPASAQALPNLGENKKQPTPAMEAKVQVKQSKHVRDVVWDEQGMTWEVYGASLDPESLGIAIQNHLQRQIREHEKLIRAQNSQTRKSISSDTSSNKKLKGRQHNVFQSMLQNFRRPNCCVRPAPSSVLD